jgi:hypothetical protein
MAAKSAGSDRKGRPRWNKYADSVIGPSICPLTATADLKRPDDNASSNAPAYRVRRGQLSTTPVKDFEHRIEPAFFYLITVAFVARLNKVFHNSEALTDDTLPF